MEIITVPANERALYNRFIRQNYPPIGAFMQTWEWGTFQEALGRKTERYFLKKNSKTVAAFTLVHHAVSFGLSYAYAPRGPVISRELGEQAHSDVFDCIRQWAQEKFAKSIFVRLEPPTQFIPHGMSKFSVPPYYVQPRFNLAIPLHARTEEIAARFHPSTRSNIKRAERRGVHVEMGSSFEELFDQFLAMTQDTIQRNSGKDVYPAPLYFKSLFETVPLLGNTSDPDSLSLGVFCGCVNGQPAAIHLVLFFGDTATYLYGASYSKYLNSKVTTYLHWTALLETKRKGMKFYDIGGIDDVRWPTLTHFKRQFRGKEFHYIGNMDIPIRPELYRFYNFIHRFKKS
ncbi:MAG: peptidoglycan bridge formation glycyltransferase FemA/FemB family protein [bacterium]|nr:peptidoglycan bridge formation glycyltransferase FemA/FemB family protein [bacterium]